MKIFLTTIGTMGDIVPFAVLARALGERGHDVTVHSFAFYQPNFAAPGVRFIAAAGDHRADGLAQALAEALVQPTPMAQIARFARYFYFTGGAAFLARCRAAAAGHDLAVCNVIDHLGQEAAELSSLPWVGWSSKAPAIGRQREAEDSLLAPTDGELSRLVAGLGGRRGALRVFRTASPLLNLIGASPALVEPPASLPTHRLTGSLLLPPGEAPLPPALAAFVAAGPPPLLVTFGALPDQGGRRLAAVLGALRRTGQRAVIQARVGPAAEGVYYAGPLPYPPVLARVAGAVHHGGAGTTHEVARAGRPQLLVPHMADQPYWAHQVLRLGLGPPPFRHLQLTEDLMTDRLAELAAPRFAAPAAAVAAAMAGDDGIAASVRLLEELAP